MTDPNTPEESFDFASHRAHAVEAYRPVKHLYEGLAQCVRQVLLAAIPASYAIHRIEARAKTVESFGDKATKRSDTDSSLPKYPEPLEDITDMAGVRVITFFPNTVAAVDARIKDEFSVVEITDKSEELIETDTFGYQSVHYLVRLKNSRVSLPEYQRFDGLTAEIQLRTILQHAWAEMEHDIQYKAVSSIPRSIRRRFTALAGMLELADREFQAIQDEDETIRNEAKESLANDLRDVVDLRNHVAELAEQVRSHRESESPTTYLTGSARAFLDKGYYEAAVDAYTKVIELHPTVHTNYIGRARARALAGDISGALYDLELAEGRYPYDPTIERLRDQILSGAVPTKPASEVAYSTAAAGNEQLAQGKGEEALALYEEAQDAGLNFVFSRLNLAMAQCLMGDYSSAQDNLASFKPNPKSYVRVNALAIRAICDIKSGQEASTNSLRDLSNLDQLEEFEFARSPLRFLKAGLERVDQMQDVQAVFELLQAGTKPTTPAT